MIWLLLGGMALSSISLAYVLAVIGIWRNAIKTKCWISIIFGLFWPWLGAFVLSIGWSFYLAQFGINTGHPFL